MVSQSHANAKVARKRKVVGKMQSENRALEREALRNVIAQWNANRLDIFELSEPNEDLEFHGVMRFYFQDSGQKVATKCIRVASDATVEDVIGTLIEKFRPDMRMLSVPSYALFELHENCPERKMAPDEKPLLVQLNWHVDDREGRFLLRNVDDKTASSVGLADNNSSFRRKLSKREKKQLKKQEKLSRMKSENVETGEDSVADKLYTELPETSFTRSISNPEAVMRRRRQQQLEKKLQQFRSKDGGPDTGGTLKIYGEALCKDVPYKTLLLSIRDCAGAVVREMLDKYGLTHQVDPAGWCLVQVTQQPAGSDAEYVLDDDECPLSILMNSPSTSSIMFHVRRRPADCAVARKRKKKPGALGSNNINIRDQRIDAVPVLVELGPDGSPPHPGDASKTLRLVNEVMEVGSANGIALQLYGPHIQPRHCVIANTDGLTSLTPCHADAHTYVNGQRIHQTTILTHGSLIKFGHSNTYRFLDPNQEDTPRRPSIGEITRNNYDRSPHSTLSPSDSNRDNFETTFDLEGNVETVSTASGNREDTRSLALSYDNRDSSGIDRYPRGQDPILPAVLEFPEEPQEQFLARVITHLDVSTPTFRLAPAYTLYLCARYRASTHYRPELTPTERAHKLTLLLQHAAMLIRHTVQDRSTENSSQAFWLANASELLHFLKSDRHVSAFSLQAQDILADSVQLAFKNLVACFTDDLNSVMNNLLSNVPEDPPNIIINVLSSAMNLLRKCRVNAALTIQLFSQLFHWISAKSLTIIINNPTFCTRSFGMILFNRLRHLQIWAESQGLELAAECHLAKILQCVNLLQGPKTTAEELANLSSSCFKLNSLQLRALLTQYKCEPGEPIASPQMLEQAARASEGVADELTRAEGKEVRLHEDPAPPLQLLLPDDGFSCDVVQGVPPGLADFLLPLQESRLCRLAAQPTSSGHWTVYMTAPRPTSAMSSTQPEVQVIKLHKTGGGMGLSIVAAKGAGQERLGIYIKSVVPGGAADRDGRLTAGDQLLSVDGHSLLGITQEKAAEFLVRTGSIVTLEVAKGGAVYHGLATLLQQPSPTPHRGPRRMSERDLPSKIDMERTILSSKSVPALHHLSPGTEPRPVAHDVFNPGYSRTSSNNSINTSVANASQSGGTSGVRSRSTHNLHQQQDASFYQNLSVYRNKMPLSPQQLGDRSSVLRSSQNSLQSSLMSSQRPTSACYTSTNPNRVLHQSIPNLKNQSAQRIHPDGSSSASYPNVNQHMSPNNYTLPPNQMFDNHNNHQNQQDDVNKHVSYGNISSPTGRETNNYQQNYPPNLKQQLNLNLNTQKPDEFSAGMYGVGLLREDVHRHSNRAEEMQAYYHNHKQPATKQQDEFYRSEMHTSKSEDFIRHNNQNDMIRYASSGNIRAAENNWAHNNEDKQFRGQAKMAEMSEEVRRRQMMNQNNYKMQHNPIISPPLQHEHNSYSNNQNYEAQMAQNAKSMQNLHLQQTYQQHSNQQQPSMQQPLSNMMQHNPNMVHPNISQNNPNLSQNNPNLSQNNQNLPQNNPNMVHNNIHNPNLMYSNNQAYQKFPPVAPKPKKQEDGPPELPPVPPTSTHPLYLASSQEPPKMNYVSNPSTGSKQARDPWIREEQEKQEQYRRELSIQWQDQQIRELSSIPARTNQQEEQLRVLQFEREFQRRAREAAEHDDEDTEKGSPTHPGPHHPNLNKQEPPLSILKGGPILQRGEQREKESPAVSEVSAPAPPERGCSYAVMSLRNKEGTKRVSFNDPSSVPQIPDTLELESREERIDRERREDPNVFIRQAESILASPTTPTENNMNTNTATPGVIGAQEVYRDPRTKRLAEQAQQKVSQMPVPEKLSFKEKMKMFAMETGEQETPKDKSKISRAQRDIDSLGTPNPSMVH